MTDRYNSRFPDSNAYRLVLPPSTEWIQTSNRLREAPENASMCGEMCTRAGDQCAIQWQMSFLYSVRGVSPSLGLPNGVLVPIYLFCVGALPPPHRPPRAHVGIRPNDLSDAFIPHRATSRSFIFLYWERTLGTAPARQV